MTVNFERISYLVLVFEISTTYEISRDGNIFNNEVTYLKNILRKKAKAKDCFNVAVWRFITFGIFLRFFTFLNLM